MSNPLWSRVDARINRALASVRQGFRAVLTGLDTKPGVQLLQADALSGEQLQASELMQHFGFTSAPPAGTQCIVLPLGGKSAHSIIIGTENGAYRVAALKSGEVAVYNQSGAKIVLKDQKVIEIDCDDLLINAEKSMSVNTKTFTLNAGESIGIDTKTLDANAANHIGLHSPDVALGGGGGSAKMQGDLWITGTSRADTDHVTGGVSLVHHVHKENDEKGSTEPPLE
jgi:phage baseplate assembly protein V